MYPREIYDILYQEKLLYRILKEYTKMLIGCCVNMLPQTRLAGAEYIPEIAAAGYDYVELPLGSLASLTESEFHEASAILAESGIPCLSCNNFMPGEFIIVGPGTIRTPDTVLHEYMEKAFERIGKNGLQIPTVVFGSPWSRKCPDGWNMDTALAQIAVFLDTAAKYAGKQGITIALEGNNRSETNTLNRFRDVIHMVQRVSHPSLKALCDYYHVRYEQDDPAAVLKDGGDLVAHIHIAKLADRAWFTNLSGEEPYIHHFAKALKEIHYTGGISIEAPAGKENWHDMVFRTLPVLKAVFA